MDYTLLRGMAELRATVRANLDCVQAGYICAILAALQFATIRLLANCVYELFKNHGLSAQK
jgi:hypothetical protein